MQEHRGFRHPGPAFSAVSSPSPQEAVIRPRREAMTKQKYVFRETNSDGAFLLLPSLAPGSVWLLECVVDSPRIQFRSPSAVMLHLGSVPHPQQLLMMLLLRRPGLTLRRFPIYFWYLSPPSRGPQTLESV
jgi:hypothetical protein